MRNTKSAGGKRAAMFACAVAAFPVAGSPVSAQSPTYADVAPILATHCQGCHQPGEIAPMSLRSFEEVRPWARSIRRAVADRKMPPWFADPAVGEFRNDSRLSPAEIETVVAWVEAGAQRGTGTTASVTKSSDPIDRDMKDWAIGEPDLVIAMPEPYAVPAAGVIDYVYLKMPTDLDEDRWIQALEVQPGDRSVVHHIDVMVCAPGCPSSASLAALEPGVPTLMPESGSEEKPEPSSNAWIEGQEQEFLTSFLPGGSPSVLPPGYARLLPKGAELIINVHYAPNGIATSDQSRIGFVFADEPEQRVISFFLENYSLWLPAQSPNVELATTARLARNAELLGITPHMHFRGRAATVSIVPPRGKPELLLRVPKYDFNWQTTYLLQKPRALVAGTVMEYVLRWDNSTSNLDNPDPSRNVPWGRQTSDEMASLFVTLAVPASVAPDEVFEARSEDRKSRLD